MSELDDLEKLKDLGLLSKLQRQKAKFLLEKEGVIMGCTLEVETESGTATIDRFGRVIWANT